MTLIGLSKGRIIKGQQCHKWLYIEHHNPELIEESPNVQALATGEDVGIVAQGFFPGGTLIPYLERDKGKMVSMTRDHLCDSPEVPLYEGTFTHNKVLVRADIMLSQNGKLRLIEVKSSGTMHDYYNRDCTIQAWVIESCGYKLDQIELAHIDTSFVYKGDGDYQGLFKFEDVTDYVRSHIAEVPTWIDEIRLMLSGSDCPTVDMGKHCREPWPCPLYSHCEKEKWGCDDPVMRLPGPMGKAIARRLAAQGYKDLWKVPAGLIEDPIYERVRRVTVSGIPEVDHAEARGILDPLPYPRYYLDFETVFPAVPIWADTRPYQQLPFQWSCHIEKDPGQLVHKEFLETEGKTPMRPWIESLIDVLGDTGPIFHYHNFETRILREIAERFPDLSQPINSVIERCVDLLPITQKNYYHPDLRGSFSIKYVLPSVTNNVSYDTVGEIQDGGSASLAYLEMIDKDTRVDRRSSIEHDLRAYCGLDTIALKYVIETLRGSNDSWVVI